MMMALSTLRIVSMCQPCEGQWSIYKFVLLIEIFILVILGVAEICSEVP